MYKQMNGTDEILFINTCNKSPLERCEWNENSQHKGPVLLTGTDQRAHLSWTLMGPTMKTKSPFGPRWEPCHLPTEERWLEGHLLPGTWAWLSFPLKTWVCSSSCWLSSSDSWQWPRGREERGWQQHKEVKKTLGILIKKKILVVNGTLSSQSIYQIHQRENYNLPFQSLHRQAFSRGRLLLSTNFSCSGNFPFSFKPLTVKIAVGAQLGGTFNQ